MDINLMVKELRDNAKSLETKVEHLMQICIAALKVKADSGGKVGMAKATKSKTGKPKATKKSSSDKPTRKKKK